MDSVTGPVTSDMTFHFCVAMAGAMLATVNGATATDGAFILGDESLRSWLLLGAFGGGCAALAVFPAKGGKEIFIRIMVSSLFGFFLTPIVFVWRKWEPSPELLAGAAFGLACMAWMIVKFLRDRNLEDVIALVRGRKLKEKKDK